MPDYTAYMPAPQGLTAQAKAELLQAMRKQESRYLAEAADYTYSDRYSLRGSEATFALGLLRGNMARVEAAPVVDEVTL